MALSRASMGLNFWGPGDEWFDAETGIEVDIVYFGAQWMEDQIKRVVLDHQASLGYSTCFWYTVQGSQLSSIPRIGFPNYMKHASNPILKRYERTSSRTTIRYCGKLFPRIFSS